MDDLKTCILCKQSFPPTKEYFYAHKQQKDGLQPRCKACHGKGRKPRPQVPEGHKRCSGCKQILPYEEFCIVKTNYDGRSFYCRACSRVRRGEFFALAKERGPLETPPATLVCRVCKEAKTPDCFPPYPTGRYGLETRCKACKKAYDDAWVKSNPDKRKAVEERHKPLRQIYWTDYYQQSKYKIAQRQLAYRLAHPELVRDQKEKYRQTPHGLMMSRKKEAVRRSRKQKAEGFYTPEDIQLLFAAQEGKCAYCKQRLAAYHIDHVIPLSRGGTNWPDNLTLACASCNCSKGNKLPSEWKPVQ